VTSFHDQVVIRGISSSIPVHRLVEASKELFLTSLLQQPTMEKRFW
jgi:hypothetical protein